MSPPCSCSQAPLQPISAPLTPFEMRMFPPRLQVSQETWPWPGTSNPSLPPFAWPSSDEHLSHMEAIGEERGGGVLSLLRNRNPENQAKLDAIAHTRVFQYGFVDLRPHPQGPWHSVVDARLRYKQVLRALFYLKDQTPGAPPLVLGTYLSGQGVVRAPQDHEGWGPCPRVASLPGQGIGNDTAGLYPFEVVLCHLRSSTVSTNGATVPQTYLTNETFNYRPGKPLSFGDLQGVFLAPTTATLAGDAIVCTAQPSDGIWYDLATTSNFEAAQWRGGEDYRCQGSSGSPKVERFNRATINLVSPHVRRWWCEKILSYMEERQALAKEAIEEYLQLSPPSLPEDVYFFQRLRQNQPTVTQSKHTSSWRHSFLLLDNTVPLEPKPLEPGVPACHYFDFEKRWQRSLNGWIFVAAFLYDLRRELRRRWEMGILLNTQDPIGLCRMSDSLVSGVNHLFWMFPFTAEKYKKVCSSSEPLTNATKVCFPESLQYLRNRGLAQLPCFCSQELSPSALVDGFNFEITFPDIRGKLKYGAENLPVLYFPFSSTGSMPVYRNDGVLVKTGKEPIGDWWVDVGVHALERSYRWMQELLAGGRAFFFIPPGASIPDRIKATRPTCVLAWMLRSQGQAAYVRLTYGDFTEAIRRDEMSYLQWFLLPRCGAWSAPVSARSSARRPGVGESQNPLVVESSNFRKGAYPFIPYQEERLTIDVIKRLLDPLQFLSPTLRVPVYRLSLFLDIDELFKPLDPLRDNNKDITLFLRPHPNFIGFYADVSSRSVRSLYPPPSFLAGFTLER